MAESAEERVLCPNCGAPAKWEYVQTETGSHHEWRFDQQAISQAQPKMCPQCAHRCIPIAYVLGDNRCPHCVAISQAEARTLTAAIAMLDSTDDIVGLPNDKGWAEGYKAARRDVVFGLRNLQPSSDSLRKLLRDVAERVYFADPDAPLDLDRIVDGVLGGKRE